MAVSTNDNILAMLKTYYKKEGLENLMFRNSPVVRVIEKERVGGKSANFSTMYGAGGATGGDFKKAKANAESVSKAAEFAVTPGQIFSIYSMNAKEVQASKDNASAYMPVAGAKMFAASEAFRKTMATSLYGRGYGEICKSPKADQITQEEPFTVELPTYAIMAIDVDTKLQLKEKVDSATARCNLTVTKIDGNMVTLVSDKTVASPLATDVLCLDGSMDAKGNPLLPIGLGGWLPSIGKRKTSAWTDYIAKPFFTVKRDLMADRLAGAFYDGSSDQKKHTAVKNLIQRCRRQGSMANLIVMNDEDFAAFADEIESSNTFYTQTSTTSKKEATTGMSKIAAAFSTNYIEDIFDDPYCHKGVFYVLDKDYVKLWSYTNADVKNDGIEANNPGKANPMEAANKGNEDKPYGLIIDDYLSVQQGADSIDGPSTIIGLLFYGQWVITNTSVCGVGIFKGADLIE